MKKLVKMICALTVLSLLLTIGAYARENLAKNENITDQISLFSADDYLPDNLLPLKDEYKYNDNEVLDIFFAEPSEDNWVSLVIIGEEEYYPYCEMETIYNSEDKIIGITISDIEIYEDITAGEYNVYIYSSRAYYEPFTFVYKGYDLYSEYFNNKQGNIDIDLDLSTIKEDKVIESVNMKLNDKSDNNILEIKNVKIKENFDIYRIETKFPSTLPEGKYLLYFIINYNDGTSQELLPSVIYIGNYFSINHIENLNEDINKHVKTASFIANIDTIIDKNKDKFIVKLKDYNDKVVAKSTKYEILTSSEYCSEIKFSINIPENLEEGTYYYDITYEGDKNYISKSYYDSLDMTDKEVVVGNAARQNSEYIVMYTYGLDAGEYCVYEDDEDGMYIGTMKVDSTGYTEMLVQEDYGYFYIGDVYVHKKDADKSTGVEFYIDIQYYNDNNDYPYISKLSPKYIFAGTDSLKNYSVNIGHTRQITKGDIKSIKLLYDGKVVSEAENIKYIDSYNTKYYNYFHLINSFTMDFNNIDANLKENTYLNMVIELDDEKIEYKFNIRGNSRNLCGDIETINYIYKEDTPVHDDENGMGYFNEIMAYKDAEFIIRNTNITDSSAILYQYDSENFRLVEYAEISTDDMTQKVGEGNSIDYYVTFENLEPDKIYYMVFDEDHESDFVYITDKTTVKLNVRDTIYVVDNKDYYQLQYLNVDMENNNTEVYYTDDIGNKKIIPSCVEAFSDKDADISLDFSEVEQFISMNIYIKYGDKIVCFATVYDCRNDGYSNVWCDMRYDEHTSYIVINGQNIDKISTPALKIAKTRKNGLEYVQGEEVMSVPVTITDKNYLEYNTGLLNLPDGRYCTYLCEGDKKITQFTEFYINNKEKSVPLSLEKYEVKDNMLQISLYNDSYKKYDRANMIIAALDTNRKIIKISIKTIDILPYANHTYETETVADAKDYKIFVISGLTSLRPLLRY